MKHLTLLLFLSLVQISCAQNIRVLDKTRENAYLFDLDAQGSLLGLLRFNYDYLSHERMTGILNKDLVSIPNDRRSTLLRYVGSESEIPIMDEDPDSPGFGEPLVIFDSLENIYMYVYPPRDTLYIDLEGVSRIVLDYGEDANFEKVESLSLYKKYNERFVRVLKFEGDGVLNLVGFNQLHRIPEAEAAALRSNNAGSYWRQLEDSARAWNDAYSVGLRFLPFELGFSMGSTLHDRLEAGVLGQDRIEVEYHAMYDCRPSWGFDFLMGWDLIPDQETYLKMFEKFDRVDYRFREAETPLVDWDPDSPNFGDYMSVTDSLGQLRYLYPAPDIEIQWMDFQPEFYVVTALEDSANGYVEVPRELWWILVDTEGRHLAATHRLSPYWEKLLGEIVQMPDWSNWKTDFEKMVQSAQKFHLDNEKDRKKLGMEY